MMANLLCLRCALFILFIDPTRSLTDAQGMADLIKKDADQGIDDLF
jgi:hypothetical protein